MDRKIKEQFLNQPSPHYQTYLHANTLHPKNTQTGSLNENYEFCIMR